MIKELRYYVIIWILLVALFNVICFVTPAEVDGLNKFLGGFWPGYGFITATFIIHMIFMITIMQRRKYRIRTSLIVVSFVELLLMALAGGICMAIPSVPAWVAVIVCSIILVFSITFMIVAKVAGENAVEANVELNDKTRLMRNLIDEAQNLQAKAKHEEVKVEAKKIYDALRYSDLTSDEAFALEERTIVKQLEELGTLMEAEADIETIEGKSDELLQLINTRNQKCKANKRNKV